jgi:SAM-dependent methyltransferase
MERDPTQRFSGRVGYYVRYRPDYPVELLDLFRQECGMQPEHAIADIGSGTGTMARMLLRNGNTVFGVEPNAEMRRAAETALSDHARFRSVDGQAEATGLDSGAVDGVVAAQAFHWFRVEETRAEFERIGRPGAWCALVWNRRTENSAFLQAYEELLQRLSLDYPSVDHRKTTDSGVLERFFGDEPRRAVLPHRQWVDWTGLRGRALSSSYVPLPGQPNHDALMRELRCIFDECATDGRVSFEYETETFWSRLR